MSATHRRSIFVEEAEVLANEAFPGAQRVLRIRAPRLAARAEPGSFTHVRCDALLPMRRPMSVMRTDADAGWAEFLYKEIGAGTRALAGRRPGDMLSVLGPIGRTFRPDPDRPRSLLIGGGVGIPPMIFLADRLRRDAARRPLALMGSEVPFPFTPRPSRILLQGVPPGVIAAVPLLEDWGVASRLASGQGFPGCFGGHVTDLARAWLDALEPAARAEVEIFACGPTPMLQAAQRLAADFRVPSQLCLEEYMACAVGGCAGCVVRVRTPHGPAMQRVCVDGPVFDGASIDWSSA